MGRNAEVTRQWKILQAIESSRTGRTIDELATLGGVCTRTIRRDLAALQEAGFALYDDHNDEGKVRWKLEGRPLRSLAETSFSIAELAALYFSRTLLESAVDLPFQDDLKAAFARLETALSPRTREFLGQLPQVLRAKGAEARHAPAGEDHAIASRLMEATLGRRKTTITYHSFSSRTIKDYHLEPYRLVYGAGALYLLAFVPAYGQVRTFAVKRIKKLTVLEETFSPVQQVADEPFEHSLGIGSGTPIHVEIAFGDGVAPYIRERVWHPSQKITEQGDGSVVVSLEVCLDRALVSWILSFGPFARVLNPPALTEQILEEIEEAREVYVPRLMFS